MTQQPSQSSTIWISSHPNDQLPQSAAILISSQLKYLSKLLSQKQYFLNYSLKKYIFKIAPSKRHFQKRYFQIGPSKKPTFSKLLFQKIHCQNCYPKKLYLDTWFNLFFIRIIRRTFLVISNVSNIFFSFSKYLHSLKHLGIIVFMFLESRIQADYC